MKVVLLVCFVITHNFAIAQNSAIARGGESHGGNGIRLDKFIDGVKVGQAVELFDTMEYDKEFMPGEQPEYQDFIAPKLKILKGKLPRTGHFIETILLKGLNPRWYFVKYQLKKVQDASETTNLIVAFEGVQIALNDGRKVQVQETFYKELEPRSRARLLIHEAIRSAIGMDYQQSTDVVKSVASLLLHNNLDSFSKEDLGKDLLTDLEQCSRGSELSPLHRLVYGDLHLAPQEISGWQDLTYLQDGLTPSTCTYETDRCVFKDQVRGFLWTKITPGHKAGTRFSLAEAESACRNLKNWGDSTQWRVPTFAELHEASSRLASLAAKVAAMGSTDGLFWSRTSPRLDPWYDHIGLGEPDESRGWGIHIEKGESREVSQQSLLSWLCVANDLPRWKMMSWTSEEADFMGCENPSKDCFAIQGRTGLLWTEPSPRYVPNYRGERKPEDTGSVGRAVALTRCKTMTFAGRSGWRLPSDDELKLAGREGVFSVSLSHEAFGNLRGQFWSDTGRAHDLKSQDVPVSKPSSARYVCVRDPVNAEQVTNEGVKK